MRQSEVSVPYSRRLPWHLGENALARALRARGREILDLTESNPTRVGLGPEVDLGPLVGSGSLAYDPSPKGLRTAREAVARYYAESKSVSVDPERVVLTASTSEAYSFLFKLLCDPGDAVLVPEPSYPLFGYLTALESVVARPYALRYDGEWHLDAGALRQALEAAGGPARAILVVSPGNPTGAYLKREERKRIVELCERFGCALVCDEVFSDFAVSGVSEGPLPLPGPTRPGGVLGERVETVAGESEVLSFALSGLSKVCGLPQMKLLWCVVAGPAAEATLATARLELIADTYLSVATPVQLAAGALLSTRAEFQRRVQARLARNRAALARTRGADASWDVFASEGGWSAILAVPRTRSEEEWALLLLDAGVRVHPGYFFDFPAGVHLVVSLLPEEDVFARGAAQLSRVLHGA